MILEARTLDKADAARLRESGWKVTGQEGSETRLRWPHADRWPIDPRHALQAARERASFLDMLADVPGVTIAGRKKRKRKR